MIALPAMILQQLLKNWDVAALVFIGSYRT
jgi:hypothetical protein